MGLFGRRGRKSQQPKVEEPPAAAAAAATSPPVSPPAPPSPADAQRAVKLPEGSPFSSETSVFEFGSASATDDRITLAGYCPVSNDLEPCRWEVLPSGGSEAPLFRIIF